MSLPARTVSFSSSASIASSAALDRQCRRPTAAPRRVQPAVVSRFALPRLGQPKNNAVPAPARSSFLSASGPWWRAERPPNARDVASVQQLVDELAAAAAREQLVVVEFYATWCSGCRALHPRMMGLAAARPDVCFLLVDGEENKAICRKLGVTGMPHIQVYCSSEGLVESMQLPASKFGMLEAAVERWSVPRCSLGGAPPLPGFAGVKPRAKVAA